MDIYGDLLAVLKDEAKNEKIVITRIQGRTNVPFDRLKKYISELHDLCLIEDQTTLKLTEKGTEYLKGYQQTIRFMQPIGLTK